MAYKPGDPVTFYFPTRRSSTGSLADTTGTPVGSFIRNGTADGAVTVTVTNVSTGLYKAAFTIPVGASAGDTSECYITGTDADGVSDGAVLWRAVLDSARLDDGVALTSDERDAIAAAWGASEIGDGRTRDYFLQGGVNKIEFAADGLSFIIYATDDTTPLYAGTVTRLSATIGGLRTLTP